jgi:hypothetical protein
MCHRRDRRSIAAMQFTDHIIAKFVVYNFTPFVPGGKVVLPYLEISPGVADLGFNMPTQGRGACHAETIARIA